MYESTVLISLVNSFVVLLSFSIASHLLTAIIIALPRSCAIPAIFASCVVIPSVASITSTQTSQRSTAATVRTIIKCSSSSLILLFLRRPAVSIRTYSFPLYLTCVSTASRVVPAISDTITLFSPISLLIIEDLPTLGLPTMATFGLSSSSSVYKLSSKWEITSSSISPKPSLFTLLIGKGSPIPRL